MRKSIFMVLIGLILAVPAYAVDGVLSGVISTDEGGDKAIYGSYIVWKANDGTIKLHNLENTETSVIGQGYYPQIYKNTVIWVDSTRNYCVVKYDIKTGITTAISTNGNPSDMYRPWIHGSKIVWSSYYDKPIRVYDIFSGQTTTLSVMGTYPVVYENMLTYLDYQDVHLYDMVRGTDTIVGIQNGMFYHALIDDKYVYWLGAGSTINRYRISDNVAETPKSLCGNPSAMAVSNGKVYFDANCGGPEYFRVREFDPKTDSISVLTAPIGTQPWAPAVYGNKVVWSYWPDGLRTFDITSPREEVYSLNASGNTVTVINPYDKRIVTTIQTSITANAGPSDAALSPGESYYYVFNSSEKSVAIIKTIDSTDYTIVSTVPLNPLASQSITGITGDDNGNAYVTVKRIGQAGEVWKVNQQTGRSLLQALTGNYPSGIKISKEKDSQGNDLYKLFVSDSQSGNVTVINLTDSSNSGITTNAGSKIVRP